MVRSITPEKNTDLPAQETNSVSQGITAISVEGYKALADNCRIEVRPLTILAGTNSSGKSSIMQPLLLMKQTLEASYDPGSLLLNGPNLRFTSASQFFSFNQFRKSKNSSGVLRLKIGIELDKGPFLETIFHKEGKNTITLAEMRYRENPEIDIRFLPDLSHDELLEVLPAQIYDFYTDISNGKINLPSYSSSGAENHLDRLEVFQHRCFFSIGIVQPQDPHSVFVIPGLSNPASEWEYRIREIIHVPGLRGNSERTHQNIAIGGDFPGTFESYIASIISSWQVNESHLLLTLEEWLEKLGLTQRIEAKQINDTQIELKVNRLPCIDRKGGKKTDMVSIADVGFGVSHVLPVLVALLAAEPDQLVYVEQPEIHLHPRAQVALAQILAEAASRGVRVVVETHSELLLVSIQSLIAEGTISPDLVKLHWFTRGEDGMTQITSADLDEAGAFGDWPEDFAEVAMDLDNRYLSAAEAKLWNNQSNGNKN
jgi:AAA15 family ATPase/GTPase